MDTFTQDWLLRILVQWDEDLELRVYVTEVAVTIMPMSQQQLY